ncbi:MAG TPA: hypothetical protein VKI41_00380 [Vicinamibacteria bacterium]|nr:hypothetical protein [Vicinamibacteria bacterium]
MKLLRLCLLLALLPLATGAVVVTYQDASLTHLPARAVMAEQLRGGTFPFLHPGASGGEPLAGNPNFGLFFPDTLLLFVLPLPVAFGLRFALPLVLAFLGARRWARAEGISRPGAETAALAFVLSGVFLSTWRFYNSGLALSVAPWVMGALVKLGRRAQAGDRTGMRAAAAELGLWGGLEVLAGEPVVALLTAVLAGSRALVGLMGPFPAEGGRRRALAGLATGAVVALLLAAPQLAATAQIFPDSSRERKPFPFVIATGTSVHPIRLLEQVVPFPYGRPDLRGPLGFAGHEFFDNHPPYLWTLHIGLPTLALLLLFGRPRTPGERLFWMAAGGAALLAFGRYLPGAKSLYPLLSLGGRIRFPVKWWYVVALAAVPLVGWAAARFGEGGRASRGRRGAALLLLGGCVIILLRGIALTPLALLGPWVSIAAAMVLIVEAGRAGGPRAPSPLAVAIALPLLLCALPLLFALLDRPPPAPPRVTTGRIYARLTLEAHALGVAEGRIRDFFRRANPELWPLTAAESGAGYAFDADPDGAYADDDRAVRKALEALAWPERAAELRLAGVDRVLSDEPLPAPYRALSVLNEAEGVRLYALEGPAAAVRFATRIVQRPSLEEAMDHHRSPGFDPDTDVVLLGPASDAGEARPVRVDVFRQTEDSLAVRVDAPAPGVLVWSRTFFSAWWATLDGRPAPTVLADGHLLGVPVPAGAHRVEIGWSSLPVAAGGVLLALGLSGAALLHFRRGPRAAAPA